MRENRIIIFYLVIFAVITLYPTVSFSYSKPTEPIVQYIVDLSNTIQRSSKAIAHSNINSYNGEVKLKLLLTPWGELKDAYISESSGNKNLDNLCLNAVWRYDRYQPFPEELGDEDRWIDVPVIFGTEVAKKSEFDAYRFTLRPPVEIPIRDLPKGQDREVIMSNLDEAIDIALENQTAREIAQKEVELARLKTKEAKRALYPAASLSFLETTGKTAGNIQEFTDREYKLKFEYPLYYGWRLKYAVEQAMSNTRASRENYEKVIQDLKVEVEVAFYSYLASKANLEVQQSLLSEAEKILDMAKKRYDLGLSTKAEFLEVEAQYKQITYQVISSQNEVNMARLSLAQAMNIKESPELKDLIEIDIDFMHLDVVDIEIPLEECMALAFRYRPDLKSKEHMVDFNDYEYKIARSKDQFKVDLTGSYGRSGGAFESESLALDKDWFLGIKVTKPLGGNTLSAAYTKEETSEKHGQTSRTESISKSVELGLLNNIQSLSEKKSTEIALKKAEEELEKTRKIIAKEVKESYLDYKKGVVQIKANRNKIIQREEELKIAKAQAELNAMPLSELLRSHMNLADEKTFYIETMGSIYQALAKLDRATGYALFRDKNRFRLATVKY